jgi:SAM-dependent methyltransferase
MSELFDDAEGYDEMLRRGIKLSGEDKFFFIRGRLAHLKRVLPASLQPRRVLDFGCGVGDATALLAESFPGATVVGVDVAEAAVQKADATRSSSTVSFGTVDALHEVEPFDVCYVNGAFHHIPPAERLAVMQSIHAAMRPGGVLSVFENNPWSIPARVVMRRIPFDADAVLVPSRELHRLALQAGFASVESTRYLFVFPKFLKELRRLEVALSPLPLGAQYAVLATR